MKQKRKVKSLIPQKKFTSKSLKTAGLVFLGSALYLASITLLSTSVAFGANDGAQAKDFEEFDWNSPITDKKEVVYAARFATIKDLKTRIIDIFMNKDGVLYITPNPVIVNPLNVETNDISFSRNEVEEGVYGHILGGDNNKVYSNNVTIIAGEGNKVNTGNDNATMLGGEKNTINQGIGVPSAIIGGSENTIDSDHNGSNVIIGGKNNTIESRVSDSAILGGESNTIENNTSNAIIGGSNVNNNKQNNVFAYSNVGNFKPENPNSFFLNMKKGVGINMEASGTLNGLYVSGAVSLGDINIKSKPCDSNHSDNYGLEGKYNGCLVGCTIDGWKMFDRGAKCEEICKNESTFNGKCPRDAAIPDSPDDYTGFCMGLANTDNATQCPELQAQMQNYKNVVFETKLIDSETKCPNSEDKCVFQCDDNYHLLKDETGINSSTKGTKKCYKDCTLPRNPDEKRKTNEKIIAYNTTISYCATNVDEVYDNCGNHKEELVCYDGSRYYTKNKQKNNGHKYESCTLTGYICPDEYNYNLNEIGFKLKDYIAPYSTSQKRDRSTITIFTRGTYKLCLDYTPRVEENGEICDEKDNFEGPLHYEHYKLITCNSGYDLMNIDGIQRCMKSCTFDTNSGPIRVKHNESTGLYLSDNKTCPDPCKKQIFKCDDGRWKNTDGADINDYKYTSCNLNSQVHDGYNISENDFIRNKNNFTTYDHINISVKDGDIFSCKEEIRYKITGCADGYHLSSTLKFCTREATRGECGGLPDNYERTSQDQEPFHDGLLGDIDRSKGSTRGKNFRIGTWDNRQYEPNRDKCTKDCIEGYEKRNGQCVKDGKCDLYNVNQCNDGGNYSHEYTSDGNHLWRCEGDGGKTAYCHICADGYSWEGTDNEYDSENKVDYCVPPEPDEDGECKNYDTSNESRADKDFDFIANELKCEHGTSEIAQGFIHNGYSWLCKKSGNGSDSELCHKCEPGYTWDPNEGDYGDCVEGNGDDGECIGDDCEGTTEDEDGICNNKIKYGCNEGHTATGKSETKYSEKTIRYCDGLGNGKKSGECFICKDGFRLSGDICVQNQSNLKCGTASGQAYTNSGDIKGNAACISGTINGKVETSSDGNKFTRTCKSNNEEVSCSAIRVACGSANGTPTSDKPTTNLCSPNDTYKTQDVGRNGSNWEWRCGSSNNQKICKAPISTFSCTGELPGNNTRKSETEPKSNTGWRYTSNTSATLAACEWTCKDGYTRAKDANGNRLNKCVEKQCGTTGLPSSMDGVLTGKSTYVGTDNNRSWQYNSGTLGACQWKCADTREKSWNGCIITVHGSCGESHFNCKSDGGTATGTNTLKDGNIIKGWTWTCQGTPGGSDQNCMECNTALGYEDTLHNGTCVKATCPAPTITGVEGRNVSFVLNGADANATMLIKTEDNENWPSGGDVSGTSSPRSLGSTPAKGYTKMRTLCKNGVWSTDSNVVEFETQMIIDSIEGCALKYHFDGNDPISGKSCCNPVRLDYSYDGVTFSPLTTTYKNGMSFASHGKEGKVYFRYSLDGGKSWSSTTSYNMSKQSCGSSSCSRTFYDGTQLNWVANGLYAEDGYKLAEISYWSAATSNNAGYNEPCRPITNNSNCTYNTHKRTLDSVTTYDCPDRTFYLSINDSATLYNAYRNHYNNTPTDKTIIYVPGADNNWCKLEMRIASANNGGGTWFNFYVDGVATHVGNLCR